MTFFHKLISFQVFDLFLHNLVYLFLVSVPTRVSAHARSHVWFTWGGKETVLALADCEWRAAATCRAPVRCTMCLRDFSAFFLLDPQFFCA